MCEQFIIQFVDEDQIRYLFNYRMSVCCRCYARTFSTLKRAKFYFQCSKFSHCNFEIVKK